MGHVSDLLKTPHTIAVVGVSQDESKYGYELFEMLRKHGHEVLPVNPKYEQIDNQICYPSLDQLPEIPDAVITAIPPSASLKIAETCSRLKIPLFWMPPSTDSEEAIGFCVRNKITAISGFCPAFVLKLPEERWQELP